MTIRNLGFVELAESIDRSDRLAKFELENKQLLEQRDKMLGMIKALSGSPNIINTRLKIQARGLINEIEQPKQTKEGDR
jgi:hypothetical protein